MSTVDRALSILRFFGPEKPEWTVEEAAREMGLPTSTVYRYFRSLTETGLIVNFASGRYVIGPAIIELDRQTRRLDPLIVASEPVLDALWPSSNVESVALLCRIYRRKVMCVHQRAVANASLALSYERGRPMPLYRGSASKIILAHLDRRVLRRCFEQDAAEIFQAGLGNSWEEFLDTLRKLRRKGYCQTAGELDQNAYGVSSPIFGPDGEIMASVTLVMNATDVNEAIASDAIAFVRNAGLEVSKRLQAHAQRSASGV